ncbi:MAG: hypothetical protein ACLFTR_01945 [Candidatus Woesearchaeota archaeon]
MRRNKNNKGRRLIAGGLLLLASGSIGYMTGRSASTETTVPAHSAQQEEIADVVEGMRTDKDYANSMVHETIEMLREDDSISPRTYSTMFKSIRDEAEDNPELVMHLGPEAKGYLINEILDEMDGLSGTDRDYWDSITDMVDGALEHIKRNLYGD